MRRIERFITENESFIKAEKLTPHGIVLHSIGVGQPNGETCAKYFNTFRPDGEQKSVHGFIDARKDDSGTLWQTMPFNMVAWHAGGYNSSHIGIEMCEPPDLNASDAKDYINRARSTAIYYFAQLCIQYGLDPNEKGVILSHSECKDSTHRDPDHLFKIINYTMDDFRRDVARTMESIKSNNEQINFPEKPIEEYVVNQLYLKSIMAPFTEKTDESASVFGFDRKDIIFFLDNGKTYFDYLLGRDGLSMEDLVEQAKNRPGGTHCNVGSVLRVGKNNNPNVKTFDQFADGWIIPAIYKDSNGREVVHEYFPVYNSDESKESTYFYRIYYKDEGPESDTARIFFDNPQISSKVSDIEDYDSVVTFNGNNITDEDLKEFQEEVSKGYLYDENKSSLYDQVISDIEAFTNGQMDMTVQNNIFDTRPILGIFGIPYQFMPHVDPRITQSEMSSDMYVKQYSAPGVEYADHIMSNMPLLFLSPGFPDFMTSFSKKERQNIFDLIGFKGMGEDVDLDSADLGKNYGRYYTFRYAVAEYYKYCNPICRIASAYLGVERETIEGVNIESLDWRHYTSSSLNSIFSGLIDPTSYSSIPFYIESESQINDTFSNDTTESSLASTANNISQVGRDLTFVIGYTQAKAEAKLFNISPTANESYTKLGDFIMNLGGNSEALRSIAADVVSVASGGKLLFPKIWADSSFSRSYDVTVKLRSPDNDPLSIYLNVLVPFFHLFCMAVPRVGDKNPNALFSPFLVRAIYKGFFNIDMGLITSLAVTKGDTAQWTPDAVPTCIDVNMSIADLYENISLTKTEVGNFKFNTTSNTALMDYIANTCGINIYQPEIARAIRMHLVNNYINRARDILNISVWGQLKDNVSNAITRVWRPKL